MKLLPAIVFIAIAFAALSSSVRAQALPDGPYIFSGAVTVNGQPAPEGLMVHARIDDYRSDPVEIVGGRYEKLALAPGGVRFHRKTITFYLGANVQAVETYLYLRSGIPVPIVDFDLTFPNLTPLTPTPTPDPSPSTPTQELPDGPYIFSGAVMVNGQPAPDGLTVHARIEDYRSGPVEIVGGRYEKLALALEGARFHRKTITFYLGTNVQAAETYLYLRSGIPVPIVGFNLTFPNLTSLTPTPAIPVDNTMPTLVRAETGRHWDTTLRTDESKDKTVYRVSKADKSSVLVIFTEHLDATSVKASDFKVNGAEPVDASAYNVTVRGTEATTDDYEGYATYSLAEVDVEPGEKLGYVFLRLSSDLRANATPKVELVGEVEDLAGNERDSGVDNDAVDRIAPTLTVTIDEGSRPATRDKVNLTITSDENIRRPAVEFYHVTSVDDETTVAADPTGDGVVDFVSSTEYTAVINTSGDNGLYTIHVTAVDTAGSNAGSSGSKSDGVDVSSDTSAILFERDTSIPDIDVDPADGEPEDEWSTDDPNAYIRIDFSGEGNEYNAQTNADGDRVGDDLDTHASVTIVSATLNGEDISRELQSDDAGNVFLYKNPDGLTIGGHELLVVAEDDAGNRHAVAKPATITITERKPFSLKLNPGWNLVSIPGEPADPDINVVIPADRTDITSVLAYDPMVPGHWLSATRYADGMFSGTLTNIVATRVYWIETNTFNALPVMIPRQASGHARALPKILVAKGWNMVPILDVDGDFKLDDDDTLPTIGDVDGSTRGYLDGLEGVRAYTFNTITSMWALVDEVTIGKGYWVYVSKAGIIVP